MRNPKCLNCGRELVEEEDKIAGRKTEHIFSCQCMSKNTRIAIGGVKHELDENTGEIKK